MYFDSNRDLTRTKRIGLAHALNLFMPGVGLLYWGRGNEGAYWIFGISLSLSTTLVLWSFTSLHPRCLLWCLGGIWIYIQYIVYKKILETPQAEQKWSRYPRSILPYITLALLALTPVIAATYLSFGRIYTFVRVHDQLMFPKILKGDLVAVNRLAFGGDMPPVGSTIAIQCPNYGVSIRRVIASGPALAKQAAHKVKINRSSQQLVVDRQKLQQDPIQYDVSLFTSSERKFKAKLTSYLEIPLNSIGQPYIVAYPRNQYKKNNSNDNVNLTYTLKSREILVLPDVRNLNIEGADCAGVISESKVLGEARYIYDVKSLVSPYSKRIGLHID